ncbi:NADPH:quinone reductase [Chitinophaga sp. CF118]|uniref:NADP-dependent oxidoreductase n=1 Tax=Chitinophaga sp. CF118 TaxID=1884367 RepID=UPI0008EF568C|nr:NADP-dependent oxidoreductase [Chitinophaga sp. CF118]SFE53889.1 NADPH:quinone reductase [Chitinophaga sp. CF118]
MKAVAVSKFKSAPEVMELPKPTVKPGTLIIRVAAGGMNPFDWKLTDGILDGKMPHQFPLIMGTDGAGIVESVGEGVTHFKEGDVVYGQFIHAPIGEGAFAEYAIVPDSVIISRAPAKISLTEAAAIPTAGMTAQQLVEKSGLKHEQTLLLVGATGGVGSFLIQLANMQGIYVIATVSDDEGASRVTELGARETINYKKLSVDHEIKAKYPDGVDGLIDLASNAEAFKTMSALVKDGGVALTTNFVADSHALKEKNITGGNFETKSTVESLDSLTDAVNNGMLKVSVAAVISLEEVPAAIELSRQGKSEGKTVIKIS